VTGAENRAALPLHHLIEKLAEYHAAPPLQGFGISAPEQVTAAIDAGAAGAISGSAIVKIIERNVNDPQAMLAELKAFAAPESRHQSGLSAPSAGLYRAVRKEIAPDKNWG
jgi:tryptophan synthase alpha chain